MQMDRPRPSWKRHLAVPAVALGALLLAACGDSDGEVTDDAQGAATDADAGDATDDGSDDGSDDDGSSDDTDEQAPQEHAEATWMGEPLSFRGVSCGTLPSREDYEIRGRGEGFYLQARFPVDLLATEDTSDPVLESESPDSVALFFEGEGGTIGDGEGYRAYADALTDVDSSATHVAGTIELQPDSDTRADEVNPDGGTIEFELRC